LPILIPSAKVEGHFLRSSGVFLGKEVERAWVKLNFSRNETSRNYFESFVLWEIQESYQTALNPSSDGFERLSIVQIKGQCLFKTLPDQPRIH
jgi:hypothetical protein